MVKRALLVGCNYPGTTDELRGCVTDVLRMYDLLTQRFGFEEQHIIIMVDTDDSFLQPTGANIKWALNSLVASSEEGDVLFFLYSGHGMRLPAKIGDDDETGYDECIVPCDLNLISDDDVREIVEKLPSGVAFTIVSDSCHSGGLIEAAIEQIGDSYNPQGEPEVDPLQFGEVDNVDGGHEEIENYGDESASTKEVYAGEDGMKVKNKALPLGTFIDMLRDWTGSRDIEVGSIRHTLYDTFKEDSSSKVKNFVRERSVAYQEESQFFEAKEGEENDDDAYAQPEETYGEAKRVTDMAVLVSGCQSHQTSSDVCPSTDLAYGALCDAIQTILASVELGQPISNRYLVTEVRLLLASQGFTQQPGLYCTDENAEAPFIC
ncbi:hypothetical protein KP509_03G019800 [Ceratopteris richardii]|uniref:Peptidase C14 caspase domain-containing protein n=1 Tax=Ceratopteris richardii TaxID=49495 RepID=A0A8T2V0Q3_CERRI|nr:hypothetical protein KP509_03G019800 [Ceratopteris richardii]